MSDILPSSTMVLVRLGASEQSFCLLRCMNAAPVLMALLIRVGCDIDGALLVLLVVCLLGRLWKVHWKELDGVTLGVSWEYEVDSPVSRLSRDGPSRRASQSPVTMMSFLVSSSTKCVSRFVEHSLTESGESGGSLGIYDADSTIPETGRDGRYRFKDEDGVVYSS